MSGLKLAEVRLGLPEPLKISPEMNPEQKAILPEIEPPEKDPKYRSSRSKSRSGERKKPLKNPEHEDSGPDEWNRQENVLIKSFEQAMNIGLEPETILDRRFDECRSCDLTATREAPKLKLVCRAIEIDSFIQGQKTRFRLNSAILGNLMPKHIALTLNVDMRDIHGKIVKPVEEDHAQEAKRHTHMLGSSWTLQTSLAATTMRNAWHLRSYTRHQKSTLSQ